MNILSFQKKKKTMNILELSTAPAHFPDPSHK